MQKIFVLLMLFCLAFSVGLKAQAIVGNTELSREMYAKAKNYVAQRDYPNAILVFNQLAVMEPKNLIYRRELAYTYYLGRDFNRAIKVIAPLTRAKEADEETFVTAGQIYNARGFGNQAFDAIEKGLKKFPKSGMLYSDYGNLYLQRKKYSKAQTAWEKGVKNDPNFHLNYYNLAKSYFKSKQPLWAIIYGEAFVNMERYSTRTEETKNIIFDSYKQLIANNQLLAMSTAKEKRRAAKKLSGFGKKVNEVYASLSPIVLGGVDIDNAVMLRTRFLLQWVLVEDEKYPYQLFTYLNNMLADGHFEAYNQWLFGKAANEKNYINWVKKNAEEYQAFEKYYSSLPFKNKPDQYYK